MSVIEPTFNKVKVKRNSISFSVMFHLPEVMADRMTALDSANLSGLQRMSFYSRPQVGDRVVYGNCEWEVESFTHFPKKYKTRETSYVPIIEARFIKKLRE